MLFEVYRKSAQGSHINLRIGLHHLNPLCPETFNVRQLRTKCNHGPFIVMGLRSPPLKELQIIWLEDNEVGFLPNLNFSFDLNNMCTPKGIIVVNDKSSEKRYSAQKGVIKHGRSDNPHGSAFVVSNNDVHRTHFLPKT